MLTERRRQIYRPRKEQRYTERQIQVFKDTNTDAQMDRGLRLRETERYRFRVMTERQRQIYTPRKEQR